MKEALRGQHDLHGCHFEPFTCTAMGKAIQEVLNSLCVPALSNAEKKKNQGQCMKYIHFVVMLLKKKKENGNFSSLVIDTNVVHRDACHPLTHCDAVRG